MRSKYKILFIVPFIIGFIGYCKEDIDIYNAIYASATLYFINPVSDAENIYILFAKFGAMIVATVFILSLIKEFFEKLKKYYISRKDNSFAIYTELEDFSPLSEVLENSFIGKVYSNKKIDLANNYLINYKSDFDSLNFFYNYKKCFENKNVFIALNELDTTLINDEKIKGLPVYLFNINEIIARNYWLKHDLYEEIISKKNLKIAILGKNLLAKNILNYAIRNNIYSLDQEIEYYVNNNNEHINYLSSISLMNNDKIIVFEDINDIFKKIADFDRVVITDDKDLECIQNTVYSRANDIYVYSSGDILWEDIISSNYLQTYGNKLSIIKDYLANYKYYYEIAMLFNYDYCMIGKELPDNYMVEANNEWNKLSYFNKGANIAKADHYWISEKLKHNGCNSEVLKEIEHIRWSRYYITNHWEYNEVRDNSKKLHNLLIPYKDLEKTEQDKDEIGNTILKNRIIKLVEEIKKV